MKSRTEMMEVAELYAISSIGLKDVCYLLNCTEEELCSGFYSRVDYYKMKIENLCKQEFKAL